MLDLNKLACQRDARDDCLTVDQIKTAEHLYKGLEDSEGNLVSPGVMPGAEAAGDWAMWMFPNAMVSDGSQSLNESLSSFLAILMRRMVDFDIEKFDPANDYAQPKKSMDVDTADLSEFKARGGRSMYQGWNDFPLRPSTFDYLAEVEEAMVGKRDP